MADHVNISLCAIFKDEEALLPEFIEKHRPLFDEMILVDTGSTDASNDIVKKYGLDHYFYKWDNNFSNARNASISHANAEYIMVLDIDEEFTAAAMGKLKQTISSNERDGYALKQVNFSDQNHFKNWRHISRLQGDISIQLDNKLRSICQGYILSPMIRVFKNGKGISYSGMIHEIVGDSMQRLQLSSIKTDIPIYHYGWIQQSRKDGENARKKARYNELIRIAWETEQTAKSAYYYLIIISDPKERIRMAVHFLKTFPDVIEFYQVAASTALELNQFQRALNYAEKGLARFNNNSILLGFQARCLNQLLKPDRALVIIERLLKEDPYHFQMYLEKMKSLMLLNRKKEAEKTVKSLPSDMAKKYKADFLSFLEMLETEKI